MDRVLVVDVYPDDETYVVEEFYLRFLKGIW
jgi:hypothetical protein